MRSGGLTAGQDRLSKLLPTVFPTFCDHKGHRMLAVSRALNCSGSRKGVTDMSSFCLFATGLLVWIAPLPIGWKSISSPLHPLRKSSTR